MQMVFALSPQAKGRVERTAGTFQDRLVTELRLAGATTIEEANVVLKDFLDRFNERFGWRHSILRQPTARWEIPRCASFSTPLEQTRFGQIGKNWPGGSGKASFSLPLRAG